MMKTLLYSTIIISAAAIFSSCKGSGTDASMIDSSLPVDSVAEVLTSPGITPDDVAHFIVGWLVESDSIDAGYAGRLTRAVIDRYNSQGRARAVDSLQLAVDSLGNNLSSADQQRLIQAFSTF